MNPIAMICKRIGCLAEGIFLKQSPGKQRAFANSESPRSHFNI